MGANLVDGGGATFRAWAPLATAVYVNGTFGGTPKTGQINDLLLAKDANGYWTGFASGVTNAESCQGYANAERIRQLQLGNGASVASSRA